MAELADNAIHLFITFVLAALSLYSAVRKRSREWVLLTLFDASYALGLSYWLLYIVLYKTTPQVFCVSELSWTAAFIFLAIRLSGETGNDPRSAKYFALPAVSAVMAVVFSLRGSYFENAIMGAAMAFLGYYALKGLILKKDTAVSRAALFFYASEYLLWIASCFSPGDRFSEPYYLIDTFLLNASLIVIAVSQWKEEAKCPIS